MALSYSKVVESDGSAGSQAQAVQQTPFPTVTGDNSARVAQIQEARGLRPRKYTGLFDGTNGAERLFVMALPRVAAWVSKVMLARGSKGVTVSPLEIATNFLSEGGFFAVRDGATEGLDGFNDLGLDHIGSTAKSYEAYLGADLVAQIRASSAGAVNEKGEHVVSSTGFSLVEGLLAVAAVYASGKLACERDLAAQGVQMSKLPASDQVFWSTIYYNTGHGRGKELLQSNGVEAARKPWKKEDSHEKYSWNAFYNATWRTATFELLEALLGSQVKALDPKTATSAEQAMQSSEQAALAATLVMVDQLEKKHWRALHGYENASQDTWVELNGLFIELIDAFPNHAKAKHWRALNERVLRYYAWTESYGAFEEKWIGFARQVYEAVERPLSHFQGVRSAPHLHLEAQAVLDDYGWWDQVVNAFVCAKVDEHVQRMRDFASGADIDRWML